MFERFTPAARQLVIEAQAQRHALDHRLIGTEHLLLALLASAGPAGAVLRERGLSAGRLLAAIEQLAAVGEPTPDPDPDADERLLRGLGIDMDDVRRSIDEAFGPGALDRARDRRRRRLGRWWPFGPSSDSAERGRFDRRAKRVMELSLREALRLKTRHIGPEHLGLGILAEGEGLACTLLLQEGLAAVDLRTAWEAVALAPSAR